MRTTLKVWVGTMAAAAGLLLVVAHAGAATIVGSKHDFQSGGSSTYKGASDQTCIYCHAPHNADLTVKPLWNKTLTTATFTVYSSPTLHSTINTPQGVSKMCLSCHDGTLAVDGFTAGTGAGAGSKKILGGDALLGIDLSNDHPVSFTYTTTLPGAANGYKAPPTTLPRFGTSGDQLECATCHNVHNPDNGFLRMANTGSAMCVACHDK